MWPKKQQLKSELGQTRFEIERARKTQELVLKRERETERRAMEESEVHGECFADQHGHKVEEEPVRTEARVSKTKPAFARKVSGAEAAGKTENVREGRQSEPWKSPGTETQPVPPVYHPHPHGIYQYMPFHPHTMPYPAYPPYMGFMESTMSPPQPLGPLNLNLQPPAPGQYPNLQHFMTAPPNLINKATESVKEERENVPNALPTKPTQLQSLCKTVPREDAQRFKDWTAATKNRASGLEFYFDKKGILFRNAVFSVHIRTKGCFKDEVRPHARFVLTFHNLTDAPLTHFTAKLSTASPNYVLLANYKKLGATLTPSVNQNLAFAIFPKTVPVDGLKLNVRFERPGDAGASKKHDLITNIVIPFHKFLRFSAPADGHTHLQPEGVRAEKTVRYSAALLRYPDEIMHLFSGIQKVKTETQGQVRVAYLGRMHSLFDPKCEEMEFEAEIDEKTQSVRLTVRSAESATQQQTQLVRSLAEQLALELQMH